MADCDRNSRVTIAFEFIQLEQFDVYSLVDLDAQDVFSFFWRVLDHMVVDKGHILPKNGKREREVCFVAQYVLCEVFWKAATATITIYFGQ